MCGRIAIANVQSLVTKKPILSQNETQSKRKRPKVLIALGDFPYKVWIVQYSFWKFVLGDNQNLGNYWENLGTIFSVG